MYFRLSHGIETEARLIGHRLLLHRIGKRLIRLMGLNCAEGDRTALDNVTTTRELEIAYEDCENEAAH